MYHAVRNDPLMLPLTMYSELPLCPNVHFSMRRMTLQNGSSWLYSENSYIYSLLGLFDFIEKYPFEPKTCAEG